MPRPELHLNLSIPQLADEAAELDADGVGLMRAEFLALQSGKHPSLLLEEGGEDGYVHFFQDGLEQVARAFYPRPVAFRATDLKTNEYRALEGGDRFEPDEENPMLGRRGCFRYLVQPEVFALELRAIREIRSGGYDNVRLLLPFVRTLDELRELSPAIEGSGIRADDSFELWLMAETPATALLAQRFARQVDGISIGSNDLVQLVLGVDRDSSELAKRYNADEPAVAEAIRLIIEGAHAAGKPVSICGDQPSRQPDLVRTLVDLGIDAISVVPQAFEDTKTLLDELTGERVA